MSYNIMTMVKKGLPELAKEYKYDIRVTNGGRIDIYIREKPIPNRYEIKFPVYQLKTTNRETHTYMYRNFTVPKKYLKEQ